VYVVPTQTPLWLIYTSKQNDGRSAAERLMFYCAVFNLCNFIMHVGIADTQDEFSGIPSALVQAVHRYRWRRKMLHNQNERRVTTNNMITATNSINIDALVANWTGRMRLHFTDYFVFFCDLFELWTSIFSFDSC
jgi:hypothetical protein